MFLASRWLGTEQIRGKVSDYSPKGTVFGFVFWLFFPPSLFFVCLLLIFVFLNFVFFFLIGGHLLLETVNFLKNLKQ